MSWDIFVQDLPKDVQKIGDIASDFRPASIGTRSQIIEKIKEVVPDADFADPSWGHIQGDNWSIEVNMGQSEDCFGFAFHVRGGDGAVGAIEAVLRVLDLRALDSQTGAIFVGGDEGRNSFRRWRDYRNRIVNRTD